jgi:hypothetical protein
LDKQPRMPRTPALNCRFLFDFGLDGISLSSSLALSLFSEVFSVNAASTNRANENIDDAIVV